MFQMENSCRVDIIYLNPFILFSLQLQELALANIGSINRRADLSKKLSVLSPEELRDLVCGKVSMAAKLFSLGIQNFLETLFQKSYSLMNR